MPAEWSPHAATWLAWPHQREDWPRRFGPIPWVYVDFVRQLAQSEPIKLLIKDAKARTRILDKLDRAGVNLERVQLIERKTDRSWTRDTVPSFVVNDRSVAIVDWKFNAWAKYDNYRNDARLGRFVARVTGLERYVPRTSARERVVLEGGAIDVNGKGALLTTEECLLGTTQQRNPGLDRAGLETIFRENLGAGHVIWLGRGIVGDDTHGHVDDLARFVNATTIVTVIEHDPTDDNHDALRENRQRLENARDQDGRPFDIVTLPMPRPVIFDGQRLPASYANFYITNTTVFVPTFNDPADRAALRTLEALFPDRMVVGTHALDLVWGLGTLHCMTHEQPQSPQDAAP